MMIMMNEVSLFLSNQAGFILSLLFSEIFNKMLNNPINNVETQNR